MKPLLEVDGVSAGYGELTVVREVSITVPEGGAVAILGANGAGKSTLLKAILGWIPCRRGAIRLAGEPIHLLPAWARAERGIGVVPEGGRIVPKMTVQENLLTGAYGARVDRRALKQRLEEVLSYFPDLAAKLRHPGGTLSGGQQQMLAIGRALMGRPRLLLVDEISMGLMPTLVREVFRILETLHQRGISLCLVEQRVEESLALAGYAYVLEHGHVVGEGSPDRLREDGTVSRAYLA